MEIDAGFSLSDSRCLGYATRRYITFRSHLSYCLARLEMCNMPNNITHDQPHGEMKKNLLVFERSFYEKSDFEIANIFG